MSGHSTPPARRKFPAARPAGRGIRPPARSGYRARDRPKARSPPPAGGIGPARPVRRRDLADLARNQAQAAAVERFAERSRDLLRPYQLSSITAPRRRQVAARWRAPPGRARMDHEIAVAAPHRGSAKPTPSTAAISARLRVDVDQRDLGAREPRRQPCAQRADHAAADDGNPVGRAGRRVPDGVERSLHVGGEHRRRRPARPAGSRATGRRQGRTRSDADRARKPMRPMSSAGPATIRPTSHSRISPGTEICPPCSGARMRVYSLAGTRPLKTSRSVPRLMPPNSARRRTSPAPGGPTGSERISARPGPTYQSACASAACSSTGPPLDWTWKRLSRYISPPDPIQANYSCCNRMPGPRPRWSCAPSRRRRRARSGKGSARGRPLAAHLLR